MVLDERAMSLIAHAEACGNKLLHTAQQAFYRAGIKFGWYTVEDVENGLVPSAKVIYFLNPFDIKEERCEKLLRVAKRQGAALVFMHGFGRTKKELVRRLTGMDIRQSTLAMETLAMEAAFMPAGKAFMPDDDQRANPASWVEPSEDVQSLAVYTTGHLRGRMGAAVCRRDGQTSVFVGALQLTADGIREICRLCGVHIYSESQDALMIGNRLLAVHAGSEAGPREIHLKSRAILTGEGYAHDPSEPAADWKKHMQAYQTDVWICLQGTI